MSLQNRNYNILIGDGIAVPAGGGAITTVTSGELAVIGRDMKTLSVGDDISDSDVIYIAQATNEGGVFLSMPIYGLNVTKYQKESFRSANNQVNAVGYSRATGTGSINVLCDTEYSLSLILKGDKNLWSQRQLRRLYLYTSSAAATQKEIAEVFAFKINADPESNVSAIVVGDGTGGITTGVVFGATVTYHNITGATNFGIEIIGKDFVFNTLSFYEKEFFGVFLAGGFLTTTTNTVIVQFALGSGTYEQVFFIESIGQGFKGVSNRRGFPVPTPTFYSSSTGVFETTAITATATLDDDQITFSAPVTFKAGDIITISGVPYTIKFMISTTVAVLTSKYLGATGAGKVITRKQLYDLIIIEHSEVYSGESLEKLRTATVTTVIASPSGKTGTSQSTSDQMNAMEAILDPYMLSTPGALIADSGLSIVNL